MEKSFQESNLSGLGMGTWGIGEDASKKKDELATLRYGLDHGIKVIDTAEMYGEGKSEKLIGEAIRGYDRSKIFLISKFYPYHASPELERQSLEKSLKRLGTDYLDLYLLHWRGDKRLSETVRGLKELQKEGLIRHWGVSNFDVTDLEELFSVPGGKDCFWLRKEVSGGERHYRRQGGGEPPHSGLRGRPPHHGPASRRPGGRSRRQGHGGFLSRPAPGG